MDNQSENWENAVPSQTYFFRCELGLKEGRYMLLCCVPQVKLFKVDFRCFFCQVDDLSVLVDRLNETNDLSGFIVTLR